MERCPVHGLAVAPDGKCVRCRRDDDDARAVAAENAAAPRRRRGVVLGILLVGAGVSVAVVAYLERRPHAPVTGATAKTSASTARLEAPDAEPLMALTPAQFEAGASSAATGAGGLTALEQAKRAVVVTMYCRPSSRACAQARQWALDRAYALQERDVDHDEAAKRAWSAFAHDVVPAFDVDGQRFAGFDAPRVEAAVDYAAARRLQR